MSVTTGSIGTADIPASSPSLHGLDGVNFFLAALLAGFGPYVAAYLAEQKWTQADIGFVLTASSVAGLLSQVPSGELLDRVRSKRALVAVGAGIVILGALAIALRPSFLTVSIALVLQGMTGGFLGPAIAAISLGLVGYSALAERLGRNQRFASTGALVGAGFMGLVGYLLSYQAIFAVAAALGLPLFAALSWIRAADIHFGQSCGAPDHHGPEQPPRIRRRALWQDSRLLVFSVCLFLFQLANASVLPLAGEALIHESQTGSSLIISALIIVPQILVALMAPWAGRRAQSWGRRPLLLIGFAALPIRALCFALISDPLLLLGVQVLDGISATVLGVLTALVIADITGGTGRFNLAQGIVGTASGIGASLSTTLSGLVAERLGSGAGFSCIAATALLATVVVLIFMPETRPQTTRSWGTSPSGQSRIRNGSNSHNGAHHGVQGSSWSASDIHSPGSDDPDQRVGRADQMAERKRPIFP
jgi:MFS family permease